MYKKLKSIGDECYTKKGRVLMPKKMVLPMSIEIPNDLCKLTDKEIIGLGLNPTQARSLNDINIYQGQITVQKTAQLTTGAKEYNFNNNA